MVRRRCRACSRPPPPPLDRLPPAFNTMQRPRRRPVPACLAVLPHPTLKPALQARVKQKKEAAAPAPAPKKKRAQDAAASPSTAGALTRAAVCCCTVMHAPAPAPAAELLSTAASEAATRPCICCP